MLGTLNAVNACQTCQSMSQHAKCQQQCRVSKHVEHVPEKAGIFFVDNYGRVTQYRKAKINASARKLSSKEIYQVLRLGNMRTWSLRRKLANLKMGREMND